MPVLTTPARRRLLRPSGAVAAAALLAAPLAAVPASPASAAPAPATAASYGAGWLARQLDANGGYLAPFGAPDVGNTAYAVLGLSAARVGNPAAEQATAFLESQVATGLTGFDGNDDPGRIGYVIMAAVSVGESPTAFGGTAPENNLVARLLATSRGGYGPDRGLFGTADPTFDGAFRQGVALAALDAAGVPESTVSRNIDWLKRQQCTNGLWTAYRADTATACPAADPATFAGPDTNSTSMAAQALAAYGELTRPSRMLASLEAVQSADGGFPYLASAGQSADPSSTALTVQAILAAGRNPNAPRFTQGGVTPLKALTAYQLGCTAPAADRGAFYFPGSTAPNVFATVQAVPALARTTLPLPATTRSDAMPVKPCGTGSSAGDTASAGSALRSPVAAGAAPALLARTTRAGTAGACGTTKGVTVYVDFTAFGGSNEVRCAPGNPKTGIAALQNAGFTPAGTQRYGLAFVCRINNLPTPAQDPCVVTPPATAYWAYYHAGAKAAKWTYSSTGASTYDPAPGTTEAWAFGSGAKPSLTPKQVRGTTS